MPASFDPSLHRVIDANLKKIQADLQQLDTHIAEANRDVHARGERSAEIRHALADTEREVEALLDK